MAISDLHVSQFYISKEKYKQAKTWIKKEEDIVVPIMKYQNKAILADGHTRLKVAQALGYKDVWVYTQEEDDLLFAFYKEAKKRNILYIDDMKLLPKKKYKILWDGFCDVFISDFEQTRKT